MIIWYSWWCYNLKVSDFLLNQWSPERKCVCFWILSFDCMENVKICKGRIWMGMKEEESQREKVVVNLDNPWKVVWQWWYKETGDFSYFFFFFKKKSRRTRIKYVFRWMGYEVNGTKMGSVLYVGSGFLVVLVTEGCCMIAVVSKKEWSKCSSSISPCSLSSQQDLVLCLATKKMDIGRIYILITLSLWTRTIIMWCMFTSEIGGRWRWKRE